MKYILSFFLIASILSGTATAQNTTIDVDYRVQRYLGSESKFDRKKYITMHSSSYNDSDLNALREDYDISIGRSFWSPLSVAKGDFNSTDGFDLTHSGGVESWRDGLIATDHPDHTKISYDMDIEAAAKYVVDYYTRHTSGRKYVPEFYEPLNEPFVHADNMIDGKNKFGAPGYQPMKQRMAELYAAIGKRIQECPELEKMKVIGYADAWPQMERGGFSHWQSNMKMFMDVAGEYMDGISVHLYDGFNVRGAKNRRSGCNSEAILDLVETYSFVKWGVVKPLAISEYGGIEDTHGIKFHPSTTYKVLPPINHIMMNLIERQDNLLISIPFIGDKNIWYLKAYDGTDSYTSAIFMPNDPKNPDKTTWYRNDKEALYKLWRDVSGDRIKINSSNEDIQVAAFRSGDTLYIAVDNLSEESQSVEFNSLSSMKGASTVQRRFVVSNATGAVDYTESPVSLSDKIDIAHNETSIFVVSLNNAAGYNNTIRRTKYYSRDYLQRVKAGESLRFKFEDVHVGYGTAMLRLSYGCPIGADGFKLVAPKVLINGNAVEFPDNWGGGNNAGGNDFFGTFEIPFDINYLEKGDNVVSVKYPHNIGHLSSAILEVERYDRKPKRIK